MRVVAVAALPQVLEIKRGAGERGFERAFGVGECRVHTFFFVERVDEIAAGRLNEIGLAG